MASKAIKEHGPLTCTVELSPDEVDAGMELTVTARVSCPHGCDLAGQHVSIRNQHDVEVARTELTNIDGEFYVTNPCILLAPNTVGAHGYRAVVVAAEKNSVRHEETSTAFSFTTLAHTAHVNAWGTPSAIAAGERFPFHVGIKCSAGCKLSGRPVSILDHEGVQVESAIFRGDVWPGTSALYFAEVEARGPAK